MVGFRLAISSYLPFNHNSNISNFPIDTMKFSKSVQINAPIEEVFAFCASPDGFEKHFPQPIRWLDKSQPWKLGSVFQFKYRFLFIWWYWQGEIIHYENNSCFVDVLRAGGGLKYFEHSHEFQPLGNSTLYTDKIEFKFGLGPWIDRLIVKRMISFIFSKRHQKLCQCFQQSTQLDQISADSPTNKR